MMLLLLQVLNRNFEETCNVSADLRCVLFMVFNPVKEELIVGGIGGVKVRSVQSFAASTSLSA